MQAPSPSSIAIGVRWSSAVRRVLSSALLDCVGMLPSPTIDAATDMSWNAFSTTKSIMTQHAGCWRWKLLLSICLQPDWDCSAPENSLVLSHFRSAPLLAFQVVQTLKPDGSSFEAGWETCLTDDNLSGMCSVQFNLPCLGSKFQSAEMGTASVCCGCLRQLRNSEFCLKLTFCSYAGRLDLDRHARLKKAVVLWVPRCRLKKASVKAQMQAQESCCALGI